MTRDSTRKLSPSFRVREFDCKGSDVVLIDDELVVLLQCIREHFGKPVHITSGYALAAALASGSVHATKATGFKLRELILYTNSSYTTLDEIKKYRENAEIDLRFDADGHPVNAGTAGDFISGRVKGG